MKIDSKLKRLIEGNALALATTDGKVPHVIAVGYPKVVGKNKVLITNIYMHKTIKNIKKNKNVAFAVWSRCWEKKCWVYTFQGTAKYCTAGKFFNFVCKMKENKGLKPRGAILVTTKNIKKLA